MERNEIARGGYGKGYPCRVRIIMERVGKLDRYIWPKLRYVVIGLKLEEGNGKECKLRGNSW